MQGDVNMASHDSSAQILHKSHEAMQASVHSTCGPTNVPQADAQIADASARLPTPKQAAEVQKAVEYAFAGTQSVNMPMVPIAATSPSWRCVHGNIVVPSAEPQMLVASDNCCNICIQWPTVIHASSYVVELLDQGTMTAQRFMRVPEPVLSHLTDLRLEGLQPGSYAACMRCVSLCGCESAPSAWSFLPVAAAVQTGPMPSACAFGDFLVSPPSVPAGLPGATTHFCPPPPVAPPSLPLTATMPTATLPAICEEASPAGEDILCLD